MFPLPFSSDQAALAARKWECRIEPHFNTEPDFNVPFVREGDWEDRRSKVYIASPSPGAGGLTGEGAVNCICLLETLR